MEVKLEPGWELASPRVALRKGGAKGAEVPHHHPVGISE